MHRSLSGIDRAHNIGVGGSVQPEGPGDPGDLAGGEHKAQAQKGVFPEDHQTRHQNDGLKECGQAQTDDLLDPLYEAVHITSGDAEHIQAANGDLDEQDAAPLQVCKKDLDHCVGHKDDTKKQHDGTCDHTESKVQCHLGHVRDALHAAEVRDDLLAHISDAGPISGQPRAESSLKGDGQRIEPDRQDREQACGQKSLDGIECRLLEVGTTCGIFDAELKGADHQTDAVHGPAQLREEPHDRLHPFQFK